jgi:hypothetical protein
MVLHIYNPSYSGGRGERITVWSESGQKLRTLSEKQLKQKRAVHMAQETSVPPKTNKQSMYMRCTDQIRVIYVPIPYPRLCDRSLQAPLLWLILLSTITHCGCHPSPTDCSLDSRPYFFQLNISSLKGGRGESLLLWNPKLLLSITWPQPLLPRSDPPHSCVQLALGPLHMPGKRFLLSPPPLLTCVAPGNFMPQLNFSKKPPTIT